MLAAALRFFLLVELAAYIATAMNMYDLSAAPAVFTAVAWLLGWRLGIIGTTYAFAVAYHSPAPRLGVLCAIGMVLTEYLAFLRLFLVIQPFERLWMGEDRLPQGPRVLLLIHGYGCNRGAWWWLRRRLEKAGYAVATLNLEPPYIAIEHYLAALDARIEAVCAETGASQVTLVGHSMGGLVARAYLEQKGCGRVEQLITLATPHAGSAMSRIGIGANSRQMEFNSPWIKALWQQRPALPMVSLRNSHDNFVMPQDSQRFPGALDVELPGLGHLAMLFSPRVARALLEALHR
jgi:triacylglycerol lipase